ncbi:MAG: ABC transporter ATP-binding protein [Armatimonadota bacterium]|nr:ABC transporter ATP-binding protein [Armatimonadota bacterium]
MTETLDVELSHVTKRYGDVVAVDDVSFGVYPGEFLTLLGPSGSGKTTILRMVGGFETATAGNILIKGVPMTHDPPYRRDTSMVFQDYALFPHKTVGENVAFGLKMRGVPADARRRRVQEALELVNLPGVAHRMPSQLSGGQRQRVALARSLVVQPAVLLLDEPLGALDAQIRKQVQIELKALQRRLGQTFLYVTHDQEEAMVISDRIAILRDGRLEQIGAPQEVYERPASRFVAGFLGECNLLTGTITEVRGDTVAVMCGRLGLLRAPATGAWVRPGLRVWIGVRPERLQIGDGGDGANTVHGRIRHAVFAGTVTRYTITVEDAEVTAVVLGRKGHGVGSDVRVWWDVADTMVIPEAHGGEAT